MTASHLYHPHPPNTARKLPDSSFQNSPASGPGRGDAYRGPAPRPSAHSGGQRCCGAGALILGRNTLSSTGYGERSPGCGISGLCCEPPSVQSEARDGPSPGLPPRLLARLYESSPLGSLLCDDREERRGVEKGAPVAVKDTAPTGRTEPPLSSVRVGSHVLQ